MADDSDSPESLRVALEAVDSLLVESREASNAERTDALERMRDALTARLAADIAGEPETV